MKIIKIKKHAGGYRRIFCQNEKERDFYKFLLSTIKIDSNKVRYAHAFMKNRNIVTNAKEHINKKIVLSFDLSNFFDTCSKDKAKNLFSTEILEHCFLDENGKKQSESKLEDKNYACRQGLSTSPALCNIIFSSADDAIVKKMKKIDKEIKYSRYADDLTFSFNEKKYINEIKNFVFEIVSRSGFKVNEKKTRIQKNDAAKKEVCGVMILKNTLSISRYHRRKLRAAEHRLKILILQNAKKNKIEYQKKVVRGLKEFQTLKEPRSKTEADKINETRIEEANTICQSFSFLKKYKITKREKSISESQLSENVYISNDPVYFLLMSTATTGWTSCMSLRSNYRYKKGVVFFEKLKGVSLAMMLSDKTITVANVSRRKIIARCLLYQLTNGKKCYGKMYGHDFEKFSKILEIAGFEDCGKHKEGVVDGHVKSTYPLPYLDNCEIENIILKKTKTKAVRLLIK